MSQQNLNKASEHTVWLVTFGYLFFLVYGSLLPFEFRPINPALAWAKFQSIPWLDLGVDKRADWMANLLLYMPLGFMACGLLVGQSRRVSVIIIGTAFAWLFAGAVAATIEFAQLFFPARTVSLNDLSAEFLGALLGVLAWLFIGPQLRRLAQAITRGGKNGRIALLIFYALGYFVLSLFPYDFLVSFAEWDFLIGRKAGWLFAPDCSNNCWLKLGAEILAAAPLGAMLFGRRRSSLAAAAVAGLLLGVLLEILQLTIASGVSQGASVLSRGVGFWLGAAAMRWAGVVDRQRLRPWMQGLVAFALIPYLAVAAWLNHWFIESWLSLQVGLARLPGIHFLPFYYHYFTTETDALVSLLHQFGLYFPLGVAAWGWRWSRQVPSPRAWQLPVFGAALVAAIIESGKLFIASQRPDPTNVLIAAVAAATAYGLLKLLFSPPATAPEISIEPPAIRSLGDSPQPPAPQAKALRVLSLAAVGLAAVAALSSPLASLTVVPLLLYVFLLWRYRNLSLMWVLALLPMLDFTPWTGHLYWNEFDTWVLATVGIGYWRLCSVQRMPRLLAVPARLLVVAFALTTVMGLAIGLLPLAPLDLNSFVSYTSPYNGLRAIKGVLFAWLFIPLLLSEWQYPSRAARHLAGAMTVGVALEVAYVLWERNVFPGLFNFDTGYRITGSFPAMHVGGAYIEAYLVTALSFVLLWAWQKRSLFASLCAAVLYALVAYCVMVTFSRGGQAAFALVSVIALFGALRVIWREPALRLPATLGLVGIVGVAAAIAWPVFNSKFSQSRLAASAQDRDTRVAHWQDAWQILQHRGATWLGAGLGSFPAAYFWGSKAATRPATFGLATQNKNTFLRLGGGDSLYFEQIVQVQPHTGYVLRLDLAANDRPAELSVYLCEKALLYSFACLPIAVQITAPPTKWATYTVRFDSAELGNFSQGPQRPIKLSVSNHQPGAVIDIDNVSLRTTAGQELELVKNGDFSKNLQYWFFSSDSHLPWHIKSLLLHVLFEQGVLGLAIFAAMLVYVLQRLASLAWQGEAVSLTLLAALTAFLAVGLVDSLIDETRLAFLFYLIVVISLMTPSDSRRLD